jgi:hypothetical protein
VGAAIVEAFMYGTCVFGQVLYWFFLGEQTALRGEECWRMLNVLAFREPCVDIAVMSSAPPCGV